MSGYSSTGQWAVRSGGRLAGPLDGRTPALALARELRADGYEAELVRLWEPAEFRKAARVRKLVAEVAGSKVIST